MKEKIFLTRTLHDFALKELKKAGIKHKIMNEKKEEVFEIEEENPN